MKRTVYRLEVIFNLIFVLAFIGLLFYFLGVQPMRGMSAKETVWICICLACGGMLMMAVYNSTLRLFTRREKAAQYFSLFCIGQSIRFLFMPGSIGTELFPDLHPFFVALGLRYIPFAIAVIGLVMFIYEIYGEGRSKKIKRFVIASIAAVNIIIPVTGLDFTVWRAILGLPVGMLVNGVCIFVLIKSPQIKKDRLTLLYLFGFILYLFSWLISVTSLETGPIIAVAFNFLFAVIHSVLLSGRFANALTEVEQANALLEDRVSERTAELRESNQSLAASEHRVKETVRNISHDLKTPMSILSANLQMLEDDNPQSEDFGRHLGVIKNKMDDLTRLIQNLTVVSRLESGEVIYNMEWTPISALLGRFRDRYETIAGQSGVSLRVSFAEEADVFIDPNEIWSVFENLINNSLRYTPEGGVIRVTAGGITDGFVTVTVSDTGCGVEPEHLPHIFERYYMADKARASVKGGSGIGLYIVKTAVEAMGGSVAAESKPGEGFEVTFKLKARK